MAVARSDEVIWADLRHEIVLSGEAVAHGVLLRKRSQECAPREALKMERVDAVPDWNICEILSSEMKIGIHEAGEKRVQLLGQEWQNPHLGSDKR